MNKKKIPKIPFVLVGVAVIFIIFSFAVIRVSLPPTEEVFIFSAFSGGGSVSDLSGLDINNDVIAGDLAGNFALPFAALQSGQSSFTTWYLAEGCTNGFDTWC